MAAGVGVGLDQASLAAFTDEPVAASAVATGHTTLVKVRAYDMRFHPDSVEVPAGDRLVIEVSNTDTQDVHDLVLDDGTDTGRLSPGDTARLDLGVVGRDVAG
ncbi:cupredoxin domain-containing protein [Aeromicrobium sp.]|uniref:cupredoxin domain-containing protein n=1 Tax=Aeromicrobium sp. TaxID=1871063 RepID=UPI0025C634CB|nr:cupredoxin domain-containing protein [Aeromicrobium sp.]